MCINEVYGKMIECQTCIFAKWEGDFIIGCRREDCDKGVVQYDD